MRQNFKIVHQLTFIFYRQCRIELEGEFLIKTQNITVLKDKKSTSHIEKYF